MNAADARARARFESIHLLVRDPLARFLARRVPVDEVEDLFAETMLVIWRRLPDVPEEAEVIWALGVARRVVANHRRGVSRLRRLVERVGLAEPRPSSVQPFGSDPALASAMACLSSTEAEILRLSVWEDLAPREIALALGISANAASIRLLRAKEHLREILSTAERKSRGDAGHLGVVERKEAR
jgi:RNA polymerase sigma-70 factor (ECF subfamily)